MITLAGHGITVPLRKGWEGRVYRRLTPGRAPATVTSGHLAAAGWLGDETEPVVHLANFALPADRGDFGSGAVELMGPSNIFIALLDYGPTCLGTALFAPTGIPTPLLKQFDPNGLQRELPGQAGYQAFFTTAGRPMCLYVVIGALRNAPMLTPEVSSVLAAVQVAPR